MDTATREQIHTRMQSSGMRTARLLTVFCGIPCVQEGDLPN